MRLLPTTTYQQQSFAPDWLSTSVNVPSGLIVGCQFTTTSRSPIYLKSIECGEHGMGLVFTQGGEVSAYGEITQESSVVALTTKGYIQSATIETGVFGDRDVNITLRDGEALVNPAYINFVQRSVYSNRHITVSQDNQITTNKITDGMEIDISNPIEGAIEDGVLTLSLPDEDFMDYTTLGGQIVPISDTISSINGLNPKSGIINVTITFNGGLLPVNPVYPDNPDNPDNPLATDWVELDGSGIPFCPGVTDTIDNYLSPSTHTGYLPLDDMYNEQGVRDSSLLDSNGKKYGDPSNPTLDLTDIDPNIDSITT